MRLIGFNFKKINVEKLLDKIENLKIETNIDIEDIVFVDSNLLKTDEKIINIKFNYNIFYNPEIAKINLGGNLILSMEPKIIEEILKQWKDKKIATNLKITIFNIILRKSNVKALQLEEEMNLPFHINLPVIKEQETEEKKDSE